MKVKLSALSDIDVGRAVQYTNGTSYPVTGVLSHWNDYYVFVQFKSAPVVACKPDELAFVK